LAISKVNDGRINEPYIAPNPSKDNFQIFNTEFNNEYQIYSTNGQLIMTGMIGDGIIEIEELIPGVYFLKISNSEENYSLKFVKE